MSQKSSGQPPFVFHNCEDLRSLPTRARSHEVDLHGGFAVDRRPGFGHIYYGMPGCGLLRIQPDMAEQEIIEIPPDLVDTNFHSTRIAEFDGKTDDPSEHDGQLYLVCQSWSPGYFFVLAVSA